MYLLENKNKSFIKETPGHFKIKNQDKTKILYFLAPGKPAAKDRCIKEGETHLSEELVIQ